MVKTMDSISSLKLNPIAFNQLKIRPCEVLTCVRLEPVKATLSRKKRNLGDKNVCHRFL